MTCQAMATPAPRHTGLGLFLQTVFRPRRPVGRVDQLSDRLRADIGLAPDPSLAAVRALNLLSRL